MITTRFMVEPVVAEYITAKYYDETVGVVRFPASLDICLVIRDLVSLRPEDAGIDRGNLEIALPDTREGRASLGKNPQRYNYISERAAKILNKRMKLMLWADLHHTMDENKHLRGIQFKDSVYMFMTRYGIQSLSEDALLKNYQRWRDDLRRSQKRGYTRRGRNR